MKLSENAQIVGEHNNKKEYQIIIMIISESFCCRHREWFRDWFQYHIRYWVYNWVVKYWQWVVLGRHLWVVWVSRRYLRLCFCGAVFHGYRVWEFLDFLSWDKGWRLLYLGWWYRYRDWFGKIHRESFRKDWGNCRVPHIRSIAFIPTWDLNCLLNLTLE